LLLISGIAFVSTRLLQKTIERNRRELVMIPYPDLGSLTGTSLILFDMM